MFFSTTQNQTGGKPSTNTAFSAPNSKPKRKSFKDVPIPLSYYSPTSNTQKIHHKYPSGMLPGVNNLDPSLTAKPSQDSGVQFLGIRENLSATQQDLPNSIGKDIYFDASSYNIPNSSFGTKLAAHADKNLSNFTLRSNEQMESFSSNLPTANLEGHNPFDEIAKMFEDSSNSFEGKNPTGSGAFRYDFDSDSSYSVDLPVFSCKKHQTTLLTPIKRLNSNSTSYKTAQGTFFDFFRQKTEIEENLPNYGNLKKPDLISISSDEEPKGNHDTNRKTFEAKIPHKNTEIQLDDHPIDLGDLSPLEDFVDIRLVENNQLYMDQFNSKPSEKMRKRKSTDVSGTNSTFRKDGYKKRKAGYSKGKRFYKFKHSKKANYSKSIGRVPGVYQNTSVKVNPNTNPGISLAEPSGRGENRMSLPYSNSKKAGSVVLQKKTGLFDISARVELPPFNFYKSQPVLDVANEMQWEGVGNKRFN